MSIAYNIRERMESSSWIRRMFEEGIALKRRHGPDNVFDLSLGNPVTEPPAEFHRELRRLTSEPSAGTHRYMENAGYTETREAVAAQLVAETGLGFTFRDVVMTSGAAGALNVVLQAVVNPGEEIIVFAPFFAEYINYIAYANGEAVTVPPDRSFLPDLDRLEAAVTPRTRAVIVNSPNNPSGTVYPADFLRQLAGLLRRKEKEYRTEIFLVSDEAYRRLVYDGMEYPFPLHHYTRGITVTSFSKDLSLPGERIGYIAVHPDCPGKEELVNGFIFCNRTLGFVNASALMQRVVRSLQNVRVSVADYQRKRDFLCDKLLEMGYSLERPGGAFYLFPRSPLEDDVTFVRELQKLLVLTVPGSGFGTPGYFRIAYCVDDRTLQGSLDGFRRAAEKFGL